METKLHKWHWYKKYEDTEYWGNDPDAKTVYTERGAKAQATKFRNSGWDARVVSLGGLGSGNWGLQVRLPNQ